MNAGSANHLGRRKTMLYGFVLFALALVFRAWALVTVVGFDYAPRTDDADFENIGSTLASTGRYALTPESPPTAMRSPLLPVLLAGVYEVAGHRPAVAQVVLLLLSALLVPLTLLLGQDIGGRRVGVLAGFLVALDPFAWVFAGVFFSETLFTFLFVLATLLLLRATRRPTSTRVTTLGIVLGLCALARPNGLMVALAGVTLLALASQVRAIDRLTRAAWVLVVIAAVMLPWVVRNMLVFGKFIPTSSDTGRVLLGVYNETCLEHGCIDWAETEWLPELSAYNWAEMSEMERNDLQTELALSFIRIHGIKFLNNLPGKLGWFWTHDTYLRPVTHRATPPRGLGAYQRAYYWILFPMGMLGLATLYLTSYRQEFMILASFVAVFSLQALLLWGDARLRIPLHPLLAVAGAFAVTAIYDRIRGRRATHPDEPELSSSDVEQEAEE
jgi:hypothetical protein